MNWILIIFVPLFFLMSPCQAESPCSYLARSRTVGGSKNTAAIEEIKDRLVEQVDAQCEAPQKKGTVSPPVCELKRENQPVVPCGDCEHLLAEALRVPAKSHTNLETKSIIQKKLLEIAAWVKDHPKKNIWDLGPEQVFNYYCATGALPNPETIGKGSADNERQRILASTKQALSADWATGATNCLTAAENLAKQIQNDLALPRSGKMDPSDRTPRYVVEIVNLIPDVNETKSVDLNALTPIANHYAVRVTQTQSGRTYIADAYLFDSAKPESEIRDQHKYVPLSSYQDCILDKIKDALAICSDSPEAHKIAQSFSPLIRSVNARMAENAARYCRDQATLGNDKAQWPIKMTLLRPQ